MNEKPKNPHLRIVPKDKENISKIEEEFFDASKINLEEFKKNFPERVPELEILINELEKENQKENKDLVRLKELEFALRQILLS